MAAVVPPPPSRSFARRLVRTEPVALVAVLGLSVLLLALNLLPGVRRRPAPTTPPTTASTTDPATAPTTIAAPH